MQEKDIFYDIMKWIFIIGIIGGLFLLIIGSIVIRDIGFVKKAPTKFMFETILFGFFTAIPLIYLGTVRKDYTTKGLEEFFILFAKIVGLHVTLQMSGMYSQIYSKSKPDSSLNVASVIPYISNPFFPVIKWGFVILVLLAAFIIVIGSLVIRDVEYIKEEPGVFTSEALMLGFFASIPLFLIGRNRQTESKGKFIEFLLLFAKVAVLHIGIQISGVYSVLYPNALT
jgi:hypothetical protein